MSSSPSLRRRIVSSVDTSVVGIPDACKIVDCNIFPDLHDEKWAVVNLGFANWDFVRGFTVLGSQKAPRRSYWDEEECYEYAVLIGNQYCLPLLRAKVGQVVPLDVPLVWLRYVAIRLLFRPVAAPASAPAPPPSFFPEKIMFFGNSYVFGDNISPALRVIDQSTGACAKDEVLEPDGDLKCLHYFNMHINEFTIVRPGPVIQYFSPFCDVMDIHNFFHSLHLS